MSERTTEPVTAEERAYDMDCAEYVGFEKLRRYMDDSADRERLASELERAVAWAKSKNPAAFCPDCGCSLSALFSSRRPHKSDCAWVAVVGRDYATEHSSGVE